MQASDHEAAVLHILPLQAKQSCRKACAAVTRRSGLLQKLTHQLPSLLEGMALLWQPRIINSCSWRDSLQVPENGRHMYQRERTEYTLPAFLADDQK